MIFCWTYPWCRLHLSWFFGLMPSWTSLYELFWLLGTIPDSLGKLGSLAVLDLSDNFLTGILPSNIGDPPLLRTLRLEGNSLEGVIPDSVALSRSLSVVRLEINNFTGLPEAYYTNEGAASPNLLVFDASRNFIEVGAVKTQAEIHCGSLEQGLKSHLIGLTLCRSFLNSFLDPSSIGIKQVNDWSCGWCQGTFPIGLARAPNLTLLNLAENRLTGALPDEEGLYRGLVALILASNSFEGAVPSSIATSKIFFLEVSALSPLVVQYTDTSASRSSSEVDVQLISFTPSQFWLQNMSQEGTSRLDPLLDLSYNNFSGVPPSFLWEISSEVVLPDVKLEVWIYSIIGHCWSTIMRKFSSADCIIIRIISVAEGCCMAKYTFGGGPGLLVSNQYAAEFNRMFLHEVLEFPTNDGWIPLLHQSICCFSQLSVAAPLQGNGFTPPCDNSSENPQILPTGLKCTDDEFPVPDEISPGAEGWVHNQNSRHQMEVGTYAVNYCATAVLRARLIPLPRYRHTSWPLQSTIVSEFSVLHFHVGVVVTFATFLAPPSRVVKFAYRRSGNSSSRVT